jgi:hypothetical protein
VHSVLYLKILELSIVLQVILAKDGDGSVVTSGVNAAQSRIKLDHIRTGRDIEIRDGLVLIKIKNCH